jgi:hypothetical protein
VGPRGSGGKVRRPAMNEIYMWMESTGFATWIRESGSMWAYPIVLSLHAIGLSMLVGFNWALDLRLLGVASEVPLVGMERYLPWAWWGFWINAVSGIVLTFADATTKMTSWVFGVKMSLIVLAVIVLMQIKKQVFVNKTSNGKLLAVASLVLWAGAIAAGRLMGYLGPVSGLKGVSN